MKKQINELQNCIGVFNDKSFNWKHHLSEVKFTLPGMYMHILLRVVYICLLCGCVRNVYPTTLNYKHILH